MAADITKNKGWMSFFQTPAQKAATMQQEAEGAFDTGFTKGQERFDSVVNKDSLDSMMDSRSAAKKEISERRRDQSRGLNARENAAAKAAFEAQIKRAGSGMRNQVAAAMQSRGLQGGVAAANKRAVEHNVAQQRVEGQRQLLMSNIALKNQGLTAYANTVNKQESDARTNLLNKLNIGLAGGQQNAQMHAGIKNMIAAQELEKKNKKGGGLLGGALVPGLL